MRVAVVGASGLVGRTMLRVLEKRNFPVSEIIAYGRTSGKKVFFAGRELQTKRLTPASVERVDLALFSAGRGVSIKYAPLFVKKGAVVVDNSSGWRMHPGVPLVVPEVNPTALKEVPLGIVANPNCSTVQLVIALRPLMNFGIKEVFVATYQAVSGAGQRGINALVAEERGERPQDSPHPGRIFRNILPSIGEYKEGFYEEETKLMAETGKILEQNILVYPTAVRVPVMAGHSEAVAVRLRSKVSLEKVKKALAGQEGLSVSDQPVDPARAQGRDEVFVSRLRFHPQNPKVLLMWVVADNLLKGAALNAVQIAERLFPG